MQLDTDTQLIGIHNQDPLILYIQFSVGDHYFIYERNCVTKSESIKEEIFGDKAYTHQALNPGAEQLLLGKIIFFPKIKRVIRAYPF